MLRLSNIRISIKLAIMSGLAILLVVGMTLNQYLSTNTLAALSATKDQALNVKSAVRVGQIYILRTWVARRNMLLAESVADADTALTAMRAATTEGQKSLDQAVESAASPEDREQLKQLKGNFAEYIASTEGQASAHKDMLNLRKRQIDTTPEWNKAYSAVTASSEFANPEIQADIRDGVSSMKDARIAYWRYSTLLEDEFTGAMHAAAQKAIASFNHAKGLATDAGLKGGLEGLLTVMGRAFTVMMCTF